MSSFQLSHVNNVVIFGAGHGIGFALVEELLAKNIEIAVIATYRKENKASELFKLKSKYQHRLQVIQINPLNENELKSLSKTVSEEMTSIDLLINSIGVLHDENGLEPEKSLRTIDLESLTKAFQVNAALTPMIAKHFGKYMNKKITSAFIAVSAKVGSIDDNKMGGWYGYRASKAALNMFIKNIALEFERTHKKTIVCSIHPGTTITELSKPYTEKTNLILHSPRETAQNILSVIESKTMKENGSFYSWNGTIIPW